jgi:hypothetical protein
MQKALDLLHNSSDASVAMASAASYATKERLRLLLQSTFARGLLTRTTEPGSLHLSSPSQPDIYFINDVLSNQLWQGL